MTQEEFEKSFIMRFNSYIISLVQNQYALYCNKKKLENSLFVASLDDEKLANELAISDDMEIEECYSPNTVGKIFGNRIISKSTESLPYKERSAIFYRYVEEFNSEEVQELMGYKGNKSSQRLFRKSFKKIRNDYFKHGGKRNDWL